MMITTNSFPNQVTSAEDIEKNSLMKEDVEGKVKNNVSTVPNINGGTCVNIEI